jgi:ribonuclease R
VKKPRVAKPQKVALTREGVLAAIARLGGAADKRALAKALVVSPDDRKVLRAILKELEDDGAIGKHGRRGFLAAGALPDGGVMDIVDRDADGELLGRFRSEAGAFGPVVRIAPGRGREPGPAPGVGDRVLVELNRDDEEPVARVIKRLGQSAHRILGVFRPIEDPRARGAGRVEPADRKAKFDIMIAGADAAGATDGDLVVCELSAGGRPHGPKRGIVREVVGRIDHPRAASILALHTHGIPDGFSAAEEAEAAAAKKPTLDGRTDLRHLPLITIDPEDARDHDDAVFAAFDDHPKNKGGVRVWVAIADVAAYVRPGSALDRGAVKRGNSTYFPDRVAPMLPEALSADLCSLRQGEERACLAVELVFNANGVKVSHQFVRGLMKSAAKLSYAQAQSAFDGAPDDQCKPLMREIIEPLWAAYQIAKKGRDARQPLELASTEHRIVFGPDGRVAGVRKRQTLEANKLIEEFMIQANVAAAEELEKRRTQLIYRIHEPPSDTKIAQLVDFLETVNLSWAKGNVVTPARFNRLLTLAQDNEHADVINEVVLRTQSQAIYHPANVGHFGLNLAKYAHFTSPIRRYADVIVHRALIRALKLGDDGLSDGDIGQLEATADHISMCERRSMAAERDANDRYIASFLADRIGHEFDGRVSGVTRFGLFVKLAETNADGLVPVSTLGAERFFHDEAAHALVGSSSGARFQLGMRVRVALMEAAPVSGGLVFELLSDPLEPAPGWRKSIGRIAENRRSRKPDLRKAGKKGPRGKRKR